MSPREVEGSPHKTVNINQDVKNIAYPEKRKKSSEKNYNKKKKNQIPLFSFASSSVFFEVIFIWEDEVLQEIPGVHGRAGEKTTRGWLQEAQEDLKKVS